ncbi:hypothetical protein Hanom_Chr08g00705491 [Helianthus anomalus]
MLIIKPALNRSKTCLKPQKMVLIYYAPHLKNPSLFKRLAPRLRATTMRLECALRL